MDIIWEDLRFFVHCLKSLPVSEAVALGDGIWCVSTGTSSENWIYWPEDITSPELVSEAVRFFHERGESFMWPVYSVGSELLESAGLIHAGDLTAMCLEPANAAMHEKPGLTFERVDAVRADEWAKTAWLGFGGDDDVPENYYKFVRALSDDRECVSLYLTKYEGEDTGVFALTNEAELMGVYYFAVRPDFRRKGIASAMMSEVCHLADGKKIVLQSTPMGTRFYEAFGFNRLFTIPVYSTEQDIF